MYCSLTFVLIYANIYTNGFSLVRLLFLYIPLNFWGLDTQTTTLIKKEKT